MHQPRWLFTATIPSAWAITCLVSFQYPGDEYGLWAIGSLPGLWLPLLAGEGSPTRVLFLVVPAGFAVMAGLACLLDRLRASWMVGHVLWMLVAGAVCTAELGSFPSWARAMGKNGSFQAYALSSLNVGLYVSTFLLVSLSATSPPFRRLRP